MILDMIIVDNMLVMASMDPGTVCPVATFLEIVLKMPTEPNTVAMPMRE